MKTALRYTAKRFAGFPDRLSSTRAWAVAQATKGYTTKP
jgi:hypothetical protein